MKQTIYLLITFALSWMTYGCTLCNGNAPHSSTSKDTPTDSLIEAMAEEHPHQALELLDSMEDTEALSEGVINYHRGNIYVNQDQQRTAEYYYRKALADANLRREWPEAFYIASNELATILSNKGALEEELAVTMEAYKIAKDDPTAEGQRNAARLLSQIGSCLLWLGRTDEAAKSFAQAYDALEQMAATQNDFNLRNNLAATANNIAIEYNNAKHYEEAALWLQRMETAVNRLTEDPECSPERADEMQARLAANRAIMLAATKRQAEAKAAYRQFLNSHYAQTDFGLLDKAVYLEAAERWNELADLQVRLDSLDHAQGTPLTMEYLKSNLGSKFVAELKSGRTQKALATAERIVESLDSVDVLQRKSDATELAVIYETQKKETQIAEQQASLSRQRLIGTATALLLTLVFFIIYSINRRHAHQKLKMAYDQLEETTAQKERIESELRIARDIQMSIVPSHFPQLPNLDIYAQMTPAREVGGDLYDYLLMDNQLYFCLGDVSGKGVPASLFMAQSTRLFRALAKQRLAPAAIANHLNNELTENNDNGMFVTMFIGLLNLQTGHLDFCNCGHNPPVIMDHSSWSTDYVRFLEMEPNAPIGLWADLEYVGEAIDTVKTRPLFIYTDGLNEAENPQQQQFGDSRLLDFLQKNTFENARQVIERMTTEVEHFRNGAEPNDDLTMMCIMLS